MASFDNICQDFILKAIGDVPGRALIEQWLQAGYLEDGRYHGRNTGLPTGRESQGNGVSVVVSGGESPLQGEGRQV